jgi:hypothetical protein
MKVMNEFESVLVIATLIVVACASMDTLFAVPNSGVAKSGSAYSAYNVAQSIDLAKQDTMALASNGTAAESLSATGLEADNSGRRTPSLPMESSLQAQITWRLR